MPEVESAFLTKLAHEAADADFDWRVLREGEFADALAEPWDRAAVP